MEKGEILDNDGPTATEVEDVNAPVSLEDGRRPLHVASNQGDVKVVEKLLRLGAFADIPDYNGNTPLHHATREGHIEVVKVLVDQIDELDLRNDASDTPLCIAYEYERREVLKYLLMKGAKGHGNRINWCGVLLAALEEKDEDFVALLLECKVDVNLEEATKTGILDLVKCALDNIVSEEKYFTFYRRNKMNNSFHIAVKTGMMEIVELFLTYDVDLERMYEQRTPLLNALFNGQFNIAEKLLEKGANVKSSYLHTATDIGNIDMVKFLLNKNINTNHKDSMGMTPLHVAVTKNHIEMVNILIENQADLNSTNYRHETPLYAAIKNHQIEIVKMLLNNEALVDSNSFVMSPIYLAITQKQESIVELLIEKKANINIEDPDGETILSCTIRSKLWSIAVMLLDAGAKVDYEGRRQSRLPGCSLLHLAIEDIDMCQRLIMKEVPIDSATNMGDTPLIVAIKLLENNQNKNSLLESIKTLIDFGANINCTNNEGFQAINLAARCSERIVVEWLLEKGALVHINKNEHLLNLLSYAYRQNDVTLIDGILGLDVDFSHLKDSYGNTGLHLATMNGHIDGIRAFLSKGVNVNVASENNETPLHLACRLKNPKVVKLLMENGADINVLNSFGLYPVHIASSDDALCRLFIEHESFVDHPNDEGRTMGHVLALKNDVDLMKLYLKKRNVNLVDKNGNTAFHIALEQRYVEMSILISKYVLEPDLKNKYGLTPLQLASTINPFYDRNLKEQTCMNSNSEVITERIKLVKLNLDLGAKVNTRNGNGNTALHIAVAQGNVQMTTFLLEHGADLYGRNKEGNTVLHNVTFSRNLSLCKILLEQARQYNNDGDRKERPSLGGIPTDEMLVKCDFINAVNNSGETALHLAVENDFEEMVLHLIENSANVNTKDLEEVTPLMIATKRGCSNHRVIEMLFHYGAVIDFSDPSKTCSLLNDAIQCGCSFLVEHILKNKFEIDRKDQSGNTALHVACKGLDTLPLFQRLLDKGANPNIANEKGETALHIIAGQPFCLEKGVQLIKHGAHVNVLNKNYQTPLLCAVYSNNCVRPNENTDFIKLLLENGGNQNTADVKGNTPGNIAIERFCQCCALKAGIRNSLEVVNLLSVKEAPLETKQDFEYAVKLAFEFNRLDILNMLVCESDRRSKNILMHYAVRNKCYDIVESLLSKGVNRQIDSHNSCSRYSRETALQFALTTKDDKMVNLFVEKASNFDLSYYYVDKELLSIAIEYSQFLLKKETYRLIGLLESGKLGATLLMLDKGVSVNIGDNRGCSALHYAAQIGCLAMVNILLRKGVSVDLANNKGETALHTACRFNKVKIVRVLIENNASVFAQDLYGRRPLHVVNYNDSSTNLCKLVNLLIEYGLSVDNADLKNNTPLHMSSSGKSSNITKLMLEKGASVNARNNKGQTPLHLASSVEVARVLIEHGAPINAQDRLGNIPLHYSVTQSVEITKLLLDSNSVVDSRNVNGDTPLLEALGFRSKDRHCIVRLLIEKGADCSVKRGNCDSLLELAIRLGFDQLQYLLDNGAKIDNSDDLRSLQKACYLYCESKSETQFLVICKHILKLKIAGLPVQCDLQIIEKIVPASNGEISSAFFMNCLRELDKVRSTKVHDSFTLGDVLCHYQKPYFLLDEDIVESLEAHLHSTSLPDHFPIYGYILRNVFTELKRRRFYLLHLASLSMMKETRKSHCALLTELVKDKIFEHLSDQDLQNIIKSGTSE